MKVLLPLAAFTIGSAVARRGRTRGSSKLDDSLERAFKYGLHKAEREWIDWNHSCDDRDDVLDDFKPDVIKYVLPMCEEQYDWWPDREGKCKKGAMAFVDKKLAECSDHDDCKKLGDVAADGIAIEFCEIQQKGGGRYSPWDKGCIRTGENRCKSEVVDIIVDMANDNSCGKLKPGERLSNNEIKDLEEKCEDEVESLTS